MGALSMTCGDTGDAVGVAEVVAEAVEVGGTAVFLTVAVGGVVGDGVAVMAICVIVVGDGVAVMTLCVIVVAGDEQAANTNANQTGKSKRFMATTS